MSNQALYIGLIAVLVVIFILAAEYAFWIKPRLAASLKAQDEAKELEQRLRSELEAQRKEILVQAKEEALRIREDAEAQIQEMRHGLARQEEMLLIRDQGLEDRRREIESKERDLGHSTRELDLRNKQMDEKNAHLESELRRVAQLSRDEAREMYLQQIESEFREIGARKAKEIEASELVNAERHAKKILLDVMHRSVVDYVTEGTSSVVELPTDDMKGRIIGREGRNIRAFEQVTGVDLIVDDTPEAVVISCFDPVRREVARITLMNLMLDGRIHPGRIEEIFEKAQSEVERTVNEAGERAADRAGISGLHPKVISMMGKLRFRTSYAQNVLDHSVEVARLAAMLAGDLGMNVDVAKRAGLLHDIGKALGPEWDGPHALIGRDFLRQHGEIEPVLHAVAAHHFEEEPKSLEAFAVIIADSISASRPGARRESLDNYVKRLTALEALANSFPGVERSYALQAGREIRLIVKPEEIDDLAAARLANTVAKRIESELEYPGQIKVTVIRETRSQQVAK